MKTPLHTLKSELGPAFGRALWEKAACSWWEDYLAGLEDERLRERAERRAADRAAEKLYCEEWIYLLLAEGFFEFDARSGEPDATTVGAVLWMRMDKPMTKTHNRTIAETRVRSARFSDMPFAGNAHVEDAPRKLDALRCWSSKAPGCFRPVRGADARPHPGWLAAGSFAADALFGSCGDAPNEARVAYDEFRAFCASMNEALEAAGEDVAPLFRVLHQELDACPQACTRYDQAFYANVLTAYLLASVHGTAALYEYGLVQRRSAVTRVVGEDAACPDARQAANGEEDEAARRALEADGLKTARFTATVFFVDSVALTPLSFVRAVELDPAIRYFVGRAPSFSEDGAACQLLLVPGGEFISRHALTLAFDEQAGVWRAEGSASARNAWFVAAPDACDAAGMVRCDASSCVALPAGSRIVLPRTAGANLADATYPSVAVQLTYRFDALDAGQWSQWAEVEEFLSIGAIDLWADCFEGRRRALYVPEQDSQIAAQWKEWRGGDARVRAKWTGYRDAVVGFCDEVGGLSPDARSRERVALYKGYEAAERITRRMVRCLSKAPVRDEAMERLRGSLVDAAERVASLRKADEKAAQTLESAKAALFAEALAANEKSRHLRVPDRGLLEKVLASMRLISAEERARVIRRCRSYVRELDAFRVDFTTRGMEGASYKELRAAHDAARKAGHVLRSIVEAWDDEPSALEVLNAFDEWMDGEAKSVLNRVRRKERNER